MFGVRFPRALREPPSSIVPLRSVSASAAPASTSASKPQPSTAMADTVKTSACTLTRDQVNELASDTLVWCSQNGVVMGLPGQDASQVVGSGIQAKMTHAPVSLVPTPFPRAAFELAKSLAGPFNRLMHRISSDKAYLRETLREASRADPFTGRLMAMLDKVDANKRGLVDPVTIMINRSDYMVDAPTGNLLQVEINMISASFACLSTQVSRLHKFTLDKALPSILDANNVPDNSATEGLAEALAAAHKASNPVDGARVLMVVQPNERNAYDQQWITSTLWAQHRVRVFRRTLAEVAAQGRVDPATGALTVDGIPVSVVYLRSGYAPTDYPTEEDWEGRYVLELSTAAKCPDLAQQLSGTKRIQQDLCRPGVVERFVSDTAEAALLRRCFAGQWALEGLGSDPEVGKVLEKARADSSAYVLKPQREGGGNNFYDEELREKVELALGHLGGGGPSASGDGVASQDGAATVDELSSYILMEKIRTTRHVSLFMREGHVIPGDSLSELGVYGVLVRRGDQVLLDKGVGHLLRTKLASSNEGGVAAGYAVLDSPYLLP